ncbi:MAG: hypothetical protein JSR98_01685, partial [Proteobacteria bacterium]|nr:hypothetical protein [Pseudomonadota bacterium]
MRRGLKAALLAAGVIGLAGGAAWAADDKPSTAKPAPVQPPLNASVRDVRDLREAALSPDGKQVAAVFAASTAEGGQSHVWLLGADGRSARQLTYSGGDKEPGERAVAWAKDGSALYFLAKRGDANRLYRLPLAGGEAQALTLARPAPKGTNGGGVQAGWGLKADDAEDTDPGSFQVSPDNRWIALVATDGETAQRKAEVKKKDDAVRVDHDDRKTTRLYIADAAGGAARTVDLPDNVKSAQWNAGSSELLVVTAPDNEDLGPAARLWRVKAADGTSSPIAEAPKTVRQPLWTEAGAVWLAQCEEDAPPGCPGLYAYDFASKAVKGLTKGLKGTLLGNLTVEKGGKSVVTPIAVGVQQKIARIDLATGAMSWIDFAQPVVANLQTNPAETAWAMVASGPAQPGAVFWTPSLGAPALRLGGPAIVPADWPMTPSQTLSWKNKGLTIEGLVYLPKAASASAKVPLVVIVHGGPSGVFQDRYSNLVSLLIAQGWGVL